MMAQKLPKGLLYLLAATAILSFAVGMYLENFRLGWLQAHPISVNLTSGVVGFSSGILAVALGLNWFVERAQLQARQGDLADTLDELDSSIRQLVEAVPGRWFIADPLEAYATVRDKARSGYINRRYVRTWPPVRALRGSDDLGGLMDQLRMLWREFGDVGSFRPWWTPKGAFERVRHTRARFGDQREQDLEVDQLFGPELVPSYLDADAPGKTVLLYLDELRVFPTIMLFGMAESLTYQEEDRTDVSEEDFQALLDFHSQVSAFFDQRIPQVISKFGLENSKRLNESLRRQSEYIRYTNVSPDVRRVRGSLQHLEDIVVGVYTETSVRRLVRMSKIIYVLP